MKRLEVLGWWFNEEAPTGLPRPHLLVGAWAADERAAVAAYLRAGKELVRFPEPSFCRFACGETEMGHADLTDGRYVWPEGLVHYIERHDVQLPEQFVTHALAHGAAMPAFAMPKAKFGLYDTAPWLAWGRTRGACLDLDGWEIPTLDVLDRIAADLGAVPHEAILACRGATREVLLAVGGGALEVHQLRAGGHAPQRFAGWHEWPVAGVGAKRSSDAPKPPDRPGKGATMDAFFAQLRKKHGLDEPTV
ncbi:MAG: hypothetical protein IT456_06415 [Planctomycetes bacterium]|nr:hypothetical protein [Planctomycetota bacterium]